MVFSIKDWFNIHQGFTLTLHPGYTALVGPNGAGKTTLLRQMAEQGECEGILVYKYDNLFDGNAAAEQRYALRDELSKLATVKLCSEGEALAFNFGERVIEIGRSVRKAKAQGSSLLVLLDAIDSGASIDRIRELRKLFCLIEKDSLFQEVYLVVAGNSFEMAKNADCVDVRTGNHIRFCDYDEYVNFICDYQNTHPSPEKR